MKIKESIDTIKAQIILGRTANGGSPINKVGKDNVLATIEDNKNFHCDAVCCEKCGIIVSSLLVSNGCPNCGGKNMSTNFNII